MPDEPNKNIEEQLTAWARKRRQDAGAPLELHPATRKLLQDEIARTFPRKPATPSAGTAGWWKMVWPRFALAGSICVALVAIVGVLLPGLAKSKSKGQQIALLRQQEKDLSADSGRHDAPAQFAPDAASRAAQAPLPQHREESGKSTVAEAPPRAAPSLAENKLIEQEVGAQTELKDGRLKAEPSAKVQAPPLSEKQMSDKAKAAAPVTAPPPRDLYAEKEQVRLRQRSAPGQAPAGGVSNSASALTIAQKSPATSRTAPAEVPELSLDGATVRPPASVSARGFAGGTASNNAPGATLAFNRPQKAGPADDLSLAAAQAGRVATGNVESLAARSEIDRLGSGTVNSYSAAIPSSAPSQRFAQVREYRVNFNSPPMPNVLSSFQLVQNGRQIRVVDTDGSIYDGGIEQTEESTRRGLAPAAELKKNNEPELKRASATTADEALASQNAFFRVAGTNLTLKQLVVFEGNFLANSNLANEIVAGTGLKADQSAAAAVRQGLLQKGQETSGTLIRGQATIGSSNRIEVNATLVPP